MFTRIVFKVLAFTGWFTGLFWAHSDGAHDPVMFVIAAMLMLLSAGVIIIADDVL